MSKTGYKDDPLTHPSKLVNLFLEELFTIYFYLTLFTFHFHLLTRSFAFNYRGSVNYLCLR